MDGNLPTRQCYPTFEQTGPGYYSSVLGNSTMYMEDYN